MPHWKDIGAWLAAVVEHWELIVVTGAIPFFLDLVDKMFDWKMPKKFYVVFIAIGLVLAMFSAWREEREGKDNSETKQHQFEQKFNQCDAEHSTLKNLADTYASQLANQQATVNTCVVTLAKNAAGEPQRTMVWTVGLGIVKQPIVTEMVLVTNKATTFRGNLSCENPFHIFDWTLASGGVRMGVTTEVISPNEYHLQTTSPLWEPQVPVLVNVTSDSTLYGCRFTLRQ